MIIYGGLVSVFFSYSSSSSEDSENEEDMIGAQHAHASIGQRNFSHDDTRNRHSSGIIILISALIITYWDIWKFSFCFFFFFKMIGNMIYSRIIPIVDIKKYRCLSGETFNPTVA